MSTPTIDQLNDAKQWLDCAAVNGIAACRAPKWNVEQVAYSLLGLYDGPIQVDAAHPNQVTAMKLAAARGHWVNHFHPSERIDVPSDYYVQALSGDVHTAMEAVQSSGLVKFNGMNVRNGFGANNLVTSLLAVAHSAASSSAAPSSSPAAATSTPASAGIVGSPMSLQMLVGSFAGVGEAAVVMSRGTDQRLWLYNGTAGSEYMVTGGGTKGGPVRMSPADPNPARSSGELAKLVASGWTLQAGEPFDQMSQEVTTPAPYTTEAQPYTTPGGTPTGGTSTPLNQNSQPETTPGNPPPPPGATGSMSGGMMSGMSTGAKVGLGLGGLLLLGAVAKAKGLI